MKVYKIISLILIILNCDLNNIFAQNSKIDSLLTLLKTDKEDTNKVNHLNELAARLMYSKPDTAIILGNKALTIAEKLQWKKGISNTYGQLGSSFYLKANYPTAIDNYKKALKIDQALNNKIGIASNFGNIGTIYMEKGDNPIALEYYFKALRLAEEAGNKKFIATCLGNIGIIYKNQADYPKSLDYYFKALKIAEDIGFNKLQANIFTNMGIIYFNMADYTKALEYNFKALKKDEELKNKNGIAKHFSNIGMVYGKQANYPIALEYFFKSLKIVEEMGSKNGIATVLGNIGLVYKQQASILNGKPKEQNELFKQALDCYLRALKIYEISGYKNGIAVQLDNIGSLYTKIGKYKEAEEFLQKSIELNREIGAIDGIRLSEEWLSKLYDTIGKYKLALIHFKKAMALKDTIYSEESKKQLIRKEMNFAFEKKEAIAKAEYDKQIALSEAETKKQRIIIFSFLAGFIIILVFSVFLYRLFIQKKKANVILSQQKEEISAQRDEIETQRDLVTEQKEHIEEIHKEVKDSINYAERIQRSFLATKELLSENLNEYFVFFKPKDVVSGDFYWAGKLQNGNFALATADSTGHGVPGAIMSILNISSLEKAVEHGLNEPSEILNHTRKTIIERLKKDGSPEGGKDGMDASLICLNFDNLKLTYSAANNSIWIIRENVLIELSHDKMPIGKHDKDQISFTQHEFHFQKGDVIYTLTDGFPDQFGGPKGKKFSSKNLKNLLIANSQQPMAKQNELLETTIEAWKNNYGEKYEQTDDITIIGIRIQ